MVKVSRKGEETAERSLSKSLFFFLGSSQYEYKSIFFCLKIFDTLNVRSLFFVFECLVGRETLSFCVSSHLKTSSWLVPNKPLVNPPVRFVFFFATRRGGLFSLFSLFSLSLSVESKGCFSFACVPRGSFLDSDSKTIRRVLVVVLHFGNPSRNNNARLVAKTRATRGRRRRRRRNRRVSSLSFFR